MDSVRRFSLLLALSLLGVALILGRIGARAEVSADVSARLAFATAHFDTLVVRAASSRSDRSTDADAIAVGYLERLRLGLGSPFRLVDEAMRDPRLADSVRRTVAWAIVGRLRRGDAYSIDPAVLDGVGPWTPDGRGARGIDHLALIDRAISTSADPRAGELTVRLAYLIASTGGTLSPAAPALATRVAALVRDRALAAADLRDLLRDARKQHDDVLDEVRRRRLARAFLVEQPTLGALPPELQVQAMNDVEDLVHAIDALTTVDTAARSNVAPSASLLDATMSARLSRVGALLPPSAQIVVTMRGVPSPERVTTRAVNEETLAAIYAANAGTSDSVRRTNSMALLSAAVALRTVAQSQPWFPGDPGPTVADLTEEFGLAAVSFERSVPVSWRPYYLAELAGALRNVQGVLPGFFTNGLSVAFGARALPDSALAMHDPRSRTLELSIATSAGTLAHELAHDVDWQAARQLFAGSNGYSSDRAMYEQRGALASSMRGLTEARFIRPPLPTDGPRPAMRAAELLAQSADWLVTSALARQGRMNGFLSAVQDPMLTGYAAGPPTAIGSVGAQSLVSALEQMTYLPDSVRDTFLDQWADPDAVDPVLLVRRVMETPVSWRGLWYRQGRFAAPTLGARIGDPLACLVTGDSPGAKARIRLLHLAVDARARGAAVRRARSRFGGQRPAWANGLLGLPPWLATDGERVVADLRSALVRELAISPADQGLFSAAPAVFRTGCL